jgi:C4-dicarboxylate-specific signal transduction histidine kinase
VYGEDVKAGHAPRSSAPISARTVVAWLVVLFWLTLCRNAAGQDASAASLSFLTEDPRARWYAIAAALLILLQALIIGGLLVERARRGRADPSLALRLRFETLLSEQSATFSSLSPADVDREINRALRRISDFFRADWGRLTEFSHDGRTARITHSWMAEGTALSTFPLGEIPWVVSRLEAGEVVQFSRVDELTAEDAARDRQTYRTLGIRSQVEVPLRSGGILLGALTFGTLEAERVWPVELMQRLQLLGELFANILSRRQSEIEAQRLRRDLMHVGRVSTMGELTTSLAHELNQPLTAILSNAETAQDLLDSHPADLDEIREILADIVEDDKRAGDVIHRLRGLLRKDSLALTPIDVGETVREVAHLVSGDAALRNVSVRLELGAGLPAIRGDRVQLQQVVLNLVSNALDAMRDSEAVDRILVLRTSRDGPGAVRVSVEDSGIGLDDAELDHIFDRFYTTKSDGLGMGLAIARSIVEGAGGHLTARNNAGRGATFSFTLPVDEPHR